ncbi:MAG: hypothetical protein JWM21_4830 [Acidobacteria bacterium]|nr:hypothetical protein [Acidobacteriota bacterium]
MSSNIPIASQMSIREAGFDESPPMHDDAVALLDSAGVGYIKKPESFRITIDKKIIESKSEVFDKLVELVKRGVDGRG